jgi:hypothetical protein
LQRLVQAEESTLELMHSRQPIHDQAGYVVVRHSPQTLFGFYHLSSNTRLSLSSDSPYKAQTDALPEPLALFSNEMIQSASTSKTFSSAMPKYQL